MVAVVNWLKDKKGSITVQSLLVISILVVILYMSFEIWKAISISQSVAAATHQAAKYIALNGLAWWTGGYRYPKEQVRDHVQKLIIEPELRSNRFIPEPLNLNVDLDARVNPEDYCEDSRFTITVRLTYQVSLPPPFGQAAGPSWSRRLTYTASDMLRCYAPNP